jgi:hypothetical protein
MPNRIISGDEWRSTGSAPEVEPSEEVVQGSDIGFSATPRKAQKGFSQAFGVYDKSTEAQGLLGTDHAKERLKLIQTMIL